ncbi:MULTISPECIES: hypothetical protein [unclassified Microcoleus]|uniref:hypothetical protein n=1 Tax=unclassified Microcoleus TaxID=2642155 RepID=UPI002FD06479
MTTGIRGLNNQSDQGVSFINTENSRDDKFITSKTQDDSVYAWISQHRDKPLKVTTKKSTCSIWDEDWKVLGRWDNEDHDIVLERVTKSPLDFFMTIQENGNISLSAL